LAPVHLIEGLPDAWVVERDVDGMIKEIKQSVIAGFVRGGLFYTRQQAAQAIS
jgi:surfactin synthase thioesterase subunit